MDSNLPFTEMLLSLLAIHVAFCFWYFTRRRGSGISTRSKERSPGGNPTNCEPVPLRDNVHLVQNGFLSLFGIQGFMHGMTLTSTPLNPRHTGHSGERFLHMHACNNDLFMVDGHMRAGGLIRLTWAFVPCLGTLGLD